MAVPFATFRPIDTWPGKLNEYGSRPSRFAASWPSTLELLKRELAFLGAGNIVVQLALSESDIRLDGFPRANARPEHPGVILAFDSEFGPLKYATDRFRTWEENMRAIALGLESLRRVERYGITKRGEQYSGWKQLGSGGGDGDLLRRGRELIADHGGETAALMATHPDKGGDPDDFRAVQAVREASK